MFLMARVFFQPQTTVQHLLALFVHLPSVSRHVPLCDFVCVYISWSGVQGDGSKTNWTLLDFRRAERDATRRDGEI